MPSIPNSQEIQFNISHPNDRTTDPLISGLTTLVNNPDSRISKIARERRIGLVFAKAKYSLSGQPKLIITVSHASTVSTEMLIEKPVADSLTAEEALSFSESAIVNYLIKFFTQKEEAMPDTRPIMFGDLELPGDLSSGYAVFLLDTQLNINKVIELTKKTYELLKIFFESLLESETQKKFITKELLVKVYPEDDERTAKNRLVSLIGQLNQKLENGGSKVRVKNIDRGYTLTYIH